MALATDHASARATGLATFFDSRGIALSYDPRAAGDVLAAVLADERLLARCARRLYVWDNGRQAPPWGELSPEFRDVFVGSLKQDLNALRVELAESVPLRAVA